jgi:hypothetical protein
MTAVAGREAIQSRLVMPQPLISPTMVGHTEGINPAFGNIGDLGAGIMKISTAVIQPQPRHFGTGINPVFIET